MRCEFTGAWKHDAQALITLLLRRYNFKSDPRTLGAVVILSADESTYAGQIPAPPFGDARHRLKTGCRSRAAKVRSGLSTPDRCGAESQRLPRDPSSPPSNSMVSREGGWRSER